MAGYRRSNSRRSSKNSERTASIVWIWLLVGMLIGVVGAALLYGVFIQSSSLKNKKTETNPNIAREARFPKSVTVSPEVKEHHVQKSKSTPPKFEFYTLLPGMEVQLPDTPKKIQKPVTVKNTAQDEAKSIQNIKETKTKSLDQNEHQKPVANLKDKQVLQKEPTANVNLPAAHYIVQAGLFHNIKDAESMKARLTLQGFNTQIQKIKSQKSILYRVALGPFAEEKDARFEKHNLEQQKIPAILILQRPKS